jgi:hypothetical protein
MNEASWSLGTLIGLPIWALFLIACIGLGGMLLWDAARTQYESPWLGVGIIVAGLIVTGLGVGLGFYPYKAEYHQWQTQTGTVEQIDKRILGGSDGSINERFVVDLGDGKQYGCDDTRCAGVREGDRLTLSCKREWQYAGVDGYGCKFVENRKAARS